MRLKHHQQKLTYIREELLNRIDGMEESRAEDAWISSLIAVIDGILPLPPLKITPPNVSDLFVGIDLTSLEVATHRSPQAKQQLDELKECVKLLVDIIQDMNGYITEAIESGDVSVLPVVLKTFEDKINRATKAYPPALCGL